MQNIQCLHHLVHIGFDKSEQPELSKSIKKRIENISDKVGYLLNFVDEKLPSREEAEEIQIEKLAESLLQFLTFNNSRTTLTDEIIGHPKEVINYLYELLNGKWQKLNNTEINEKNSDSYFHSILSEDFLCILLKLVEKFYRTNIYGIKTSENIEDSYTNNQNRRDEIMDYARSLLGDERIIVSGMNDYDLSRILYIQGRKEAKIFEKFAGYKIEIRKKEFGNANDYVGDIRDIIIKMRFERFKSLFFESLIKKGYVIDNRLTEHIFGGEYHNRCVRDYSYIMNFYGIPKNKMILDSFISLVRSDDEKYYN